MQVSTSLTINYSFCEDNYSGILEWKLSQFLYEFFLLIILLFLSYKNSLIKQSQFMEEGQSGARLVLAVTIVTLLTLVVLIYFGLDIAMYTYVYWALALYTTLSPVFFSCVLFIPKVSPQYTKSDPTIVLFVYIIFTWVVDVL